MFPLIPLPVTATHNDLSAPEAVGAHVPRDHLLLCDLIFGLPGQTTHSGQNDLDITSDLSLDGVDLYAMNLLPDTPLLRAMTNGRTTVADAGRRLALQGGIEVGRLDLSTRVDDPAPLLTALQNLLSQLKMKSGKGLSAIALDNLHRLNITQREGNHCPAC